MYRFSRLMLMCAVLLYLYCLVVILILVTQSYSPWPAIIVAAYVSWRLRNRKGPRPTVMGSARVSEKEDLQRNGMLRARKGLILGRVVWPAGRLATIKQLFDGSVKAKDACLEFVSRRRREQGRLVRMPAINTMVVAPVGAGKSSGIVLPFLYTCEDSVVCVDFKGELAALTAEHRRRMGHKVVILDPFKVITK